MKTIKKIGLSLALIPLFASMNASAGLFDDTSFIDNAGSNGGEFFEDVFFGGSFGQSEADDYCTMSTSCNSEDTSWKIHGGYTLNSLMDLEVAYHSLGDVSRETVNGTEAAELAALSMSVVGKYKINETIEAFGKLGASRWTSSSPAVTEDGIDLSYGFGAKVSLNESMKIRAEWENISGVDTGAEESNVNTMSLGIELSTL